MCLQSILHAVISFRSSFKALLGLCFTWGLFLLNNFGLFAMWQLPDSKHRRWIPEFHQEEALRRETNSKQQVSSANYNTGRGGSSGVYLLPILYVYSLSTLLAPDNHPVHLSWTVPSKLGLFHCGWCLSWSRWLGSCGSCAHWHHWSSCLRPGFLCVKAQLGSRLGTISDTSPSGKAVIPSHCETWQSHSFLQWLLFATLILL